MARRRDGTARRYEFQIFDNPQGRVIADALDRVQATGGSAADFIREALLFYIEHQAQPSAPPAPEVRQEISALWKALAQTTRPAATSTPDPTPGVVSSSGLDLSSRRRPPRTVPSATAAPASSRPHYDPDESSRILLKTIREFSSNLQRGQP